MLRNSIAPHLAGVMGLDRFCKEGVLKKKGQKGRVYYIKDIWPNNYFFPLGDLIWTCILS